MSFGDLTDDQQRFASQVAAGTGLSPVVVRSWIGAESGWGVTKPTHNYLNIGPGRAYPSVDDAALATVHLLNSSSNYAGIRAAVARGPEAQVSAIVASPWDAGHYARDAGNLLERTFGRAAQSVASGELVSWYDPRDWIDNAGDVAGDVGGAVGSAFTGLLNLDGIGRQVLVAGLGLVFTLAALALVVLGLHRLTGVNPSDTFAKAAGVAKFAAI
jgi:hypothetical protein